MNISKYEVNSKSEFSLDFTFKFFWFSAIVLLVLNLNYALGLGNINWMERLLFLAAGSIFVFKNPINNKYATTGFILIVFTILFFAMLADFLEFSWSRVFEATIALISILLFFLASPNNHERLFMLKTIAYITPALMMTGIIYYLLIGRPNFIIDHTGALRYGGGTIPAFLAGAAYASSISFSLLFRFQKDIKYVVLLFGSLFVCMLTGSRMPTVCIVICIFTILFLSIKDWFYRLIISVSSLMIIFLSLITIGDQLLIRFLSDSSSGRDIIWNYVLFWTEKSPWTGVGFGHQHLLIPDFIQKITFTRATHNEYIRLSAELGLVGVFLFFIGLFMIFYFSTKRKNIMDVFVAIVVLGTYFLFTYSDNTLSVAYYLFAPLAYSLGSGLIEKKH